MNVVHLVGLSMRSIEDLLRDGATLGSDSVGRLSHALDGLPKEFGPKGELIRALIPAAMKDL